MLDSASRNYQEKRDYIRMKIEAPVNIGVVADGSTYQGVCRDLSGGGMLVEMDTVLPAGTAVEVTIASSHGHNPMLNAKAEVTRVISQPESETQPCLLGMQIVEVLN